MTSQSFCISNLIMKLDMASCMFTFPYPIQWSQLFVKFEVPKIRPHHTLLGNKILKISSLGENHLEVAKCVCDGGGLSRLAYSCIFQASLHGIPSPKIQVPNMEAKSQLFSLEKS